MPEERRLVTVLFADFLVTGDAVNVAARPQQAAEPWAILCGERTARAAGDGFEMGPRVDLDDKGKRQAILAATVGAGEGEVSDRSALFAAWRTAVEAASAAAPLVLVFEDLHWSSDSLLELVEFVMQPRGAAPVLMVALTRPELLERRPTWGGGRRNHLALSLEPLDDGAVARLVEHLLEAASPEIVARAVERAATIFEWIGVAAYAARARCEDALLVGDGRELDAGLAVLDRLGDLEGPARYRRRL